MLKPMTSNKPVTQDRVSDDIDEALDEALKEGFPASDPVAIDIEHPSKADKVKK